MWDHDLSLLGLSCLIYEVGTIKVPPISFVMKMMEQGPCAETPSHSLECQLLALILLLATSPGSSMGETHCFQRLSDSFLTTQQYS